MTLRTCSAEDLVVLKVFAGRDKDWAAVRGILVRQEGKLDWDRIISRLVPLCEAVGTADSELRLARLRSELERKQ